MISDCNHGNPDVGQNGSLLDSYPQWLYVLCMYSCAYGPRQLLLYTNRTCDTRRTTTSHLIQMTTPSQGVEMSVTTTHNHPVNALDKLMNINQHTHLFQSHLFHIKQKVN